MELNSGQVAIGEEGLGMLADQLQIEAVEQVVGAIAAAQAGHHARLFIGEGAMQVFEALRLGSGKVERSLLEGVVSKPGHKAQRAQTFQAPFGELKPGGGRGRNHAHAGTLTCGEELQEREPLWNQFGIDRRRHIYHASPRAIKAAGPVSLSSVPGPSQATVCAPPGAATVSGDLASPSAIAAVAAAELPVPEEEVGPTPRSKMRISISVGLTMRTNSTFVCWGKSGWTQISAPIAAHERPATANSALSATMTKCGLPVETSSPSR